MWGIYTRIVPSQGKCWGNVHVSTWQTQDEKSPFYCVFWNTPKTYSASRDYVTMVSHFQFGNRLSFEVSFSFFWFFFNANRRWSESTKGNSGVGFERFYDLGNLNGFQLKHWELNLSSIKTQQKRSFQRNTCSQWEYYYFIKMPIILMVSDKGERSGISDPQKSRKQK